MKSLLRAAALALLGAMLPATAPAAVPIDNQVYSGLFGLHPTIGRDVFGPNGLYVVNFVDEASLDNWWWEPQSNFRNGAMGNWLWTCGSGDLHVVCGNPIELTVSHGGTWYGAPGNGAFPSIDASGNAIAWEEYAQSPDIAIGWAQPWNLAGATWHLAGNGRDEKRPVADGNHVVYMTEGVGIGYDVQQYDTISQTVTWTAPDTGDETHPHARFGYIVWQTAAFPGGLAWRDRNTGTIQAVPTPPRRGRASGDTADR